MICDSCTTCPPAPLLPLPLCPLLSSSGRRCDGVGRPPPSPGACETPGRHASGWPPSSTRSSTAGRWRWRRRTVQTSRRSEFPGTRRTAGRPARMASLPPAIRRESCHQPCYFLSTPCFCILQFFCSMSQDVVQHMYRNKAEEMRKWNRWLPGGRKSNSKTIFFGKCNKYTFYFLCPATNKTTGIVL